MSKMEALRLIRWLLKKLRHKDFSLEKALKLYNEFMEQL